MGEERHEGYEHLKRVVSKHVSGTNAPTVRAAHSPYEAPQAVVIGDVLYAMQGTIGKLQGLDDRLEAVESEVNRMWWLLSGAIVVLVILLGIYALSATFAAWWWIGRIASSSAGIAP